MLQRWFTILQSWVALSNVFSHLIVSCCASVTMFEVILANICGTAVNFNIFLECEKLNLSLWEPVFTFLLFSETHNRFRYWVGYYGIAEKFKAATHPQGLPQISPPPLRRHLTIPTRETSWQRPRTPEGCGFIGNPPIILLLCPLQHTYTNIYTHNSRLPRHFWNPLIPVKNFQPEPEIRSCTGITQAA